MHVHITIYLGWSQLTLLQQTYYNAEVDPGTPQHLRWSFLLQLQTAKSP